MFSRIHPTSSQRNGHALLRALIAVSLYAQPAVYAIAQSAQPPSAATQSADDAAKDAAQNPVAAAISVPFQNNTYYDVGPYRRAENVLLVEPVIPFKLSSNWALITRTIVPIEVVPRLSSTDGVDYGLGNIQPQVYLSPTHPGKFIWGLGGEAYLASATDDELGVNKWGGGPAVVGLYHQGAWLGGALISNAFAEMTLNPFLFYNMKRGWYFAYSGVITSDWTASRDHRWTVPVGGGVGRVFKIGNQPLNARTEFLNNVRTTSYGPSWQVQEQLQFVFLPHKK
jgi:hypothetical protein